MLLTTYFSAYFSHKTPTLIPVYSINIQSKDFWKNEYHSISLHIIAYHIIFHHVKAYCSIIAHILAFYRTVSNSAVTSSKMLEYSTRNYSSTILAWQAMLELDSTRKPKTRKYSKVLGNTIKFRILAKICPNSKLSNEYVM